MSAFRPTRGSLSVLAAMTGLACASFAHAQGSMYGNASEGTARAPWYILPSASIFDPENKFGVDRRGEGFSLRAGKVLSPSWDIQFGPSFASSSKGGNEIQRTTLDVAALYMFSRERFRPFALFGMGGEYDKVKSASPNVSGTSPFVTAGLGFQYALNEKWGMQADVRRSHSYIRNDAFGFTRANSNLFTLGLIYVLGDTPARPAVARQEAPPPAPYVAPAPAPAPAVVAEAPAPGPATLRMERVTISASELFAFDSAVLPAKHPKLDELVTFLKTEQQIRTVTISGHSDRIGTPRYNLKLSQQRADAVKLYMSNNGIAADRMTATGFGETQPVVQCTEKSLPALIVCLQPNRRVEIDKIEVERPVAP